MTESPTEEFHERILLILLFAIASIAVLYFFGMILVQSVMLVGNIALVPGILAWEKYSKTKSEKYPDEESLAEKKSEIKKIQKQINRTKDPVERSVLISRRRGADGELRQQRWTTQDGEMDKMNVTHNEMSNLDLLRFPLRLQGDKVSEKKFETTDDERKRLSKILLDAKQLLSKEPRSSIGHYPSAADQ